MTTFKSDILVIGAGLVGSSVAMHLARLGAGSIRVVDFDLEGSLSSSELNAGGVRATWNQPVNIRSSQHSIEYFAANAAEVGYRACGYLWMQTPEQMSKALKSRERQIALGWDVEAWDVAQLRSKIPFVDKTDDLAGAIFAPRDGLVNPNLLKNHYRTEARKLGVIFDDRTLVRSSAASAGGISVRCEFFEQAPGHDQKVEVLSGKPTSGKNGQVVQYHASKVVNCAGPWAGEVAQALGYKSPCFPVRRQVCIFDCRGLDLTPFGMMVDTSGVYFHPEAMNVLAGVSNRDEAQGINFSYEGDRFFEEQIWPQLAERASAFENLKHVTGWAGLYEVSPDESAIIGQVLGGKVSDQVFEAHSFSGHGVMHSYSAGLGIAEKMVHGSYRTLDLSELSGSRFEKAEFVRETAVI